MIKELENYKNLELFSNLETCTYQYSLKFEKISELIEYFEKSYMSMVSIDIKKNIGYFTIKNENVFKDNNQVKNSNDFITIKKRDKHFANSILIPTYIKHKKYFHELIKSIHEKVKSNYSINIIFSNFEEMLDIMSEIYDVSNINVYIYNLDYNNANHYNYQSSKKFFGLIKSNYEKCMIIDSDFYFNKLTNLNDDIKFYENIIIKNKPIINLDMEVMKNVNQLLRTNFDYFPLEVPWIVEKNMVLEIYDYLKKENLNICQMEKKENLYEIIIYRYYVAKYHKDKYKFIEVEQPGFLFDQNNKNKYKYAENGCLNNQSNFTLVLHKDRITPQKSFISTSSAIAKNNKATNSIKFKIFNSNKQYIPTPTNTPTPTYINDIKNDAVKHMDSINILPKMSELAKKYDTDKNTAHSYIDKIYEDLFNKKRNDIKNIMEIGILSGSSLLLWRDYFTNATIYGVDINSFYFKDPKIITICADAYAEEFISSLRDDYYDVVIDDGPHTIQSMITFVSKYLSKVKSGGFLILEDIQEISWIEKIKENIDKNFIDNTKIYDLRSIKNRSDDIALVINK